MSNVANQTAVNTFKAKANEVFGLGLAEAALANATVSDVIEKIKESDSWKGQSIDDIRDNMDGAFSAMLPAGTTFEDTLDTEAKISAFLLEHFGEIEDTSSASSSGEGYKKAEKANEIKMKATLAITSVERRENKTVGKPSADGTVNHQVIVAGQLYEAVEGPVPFVAHDLTFSHNARYMSSLKDTVFSGLGEKSFDKGYSIPSFPENKDESRYTLCTFSKQVAGETTWKNFDKEDVASLGKSGKAMNPASGMMEDYVLCYHTQTSDQWSLDKVHGKANPQTVKLIKDVFMSKKDKIDLAQEANLDLIEATMKRFNLPFAEAAKYLNISGTQTVINI